MLIISHLISACALKMATFSLFLACDCFSSYGTNSPSSKPVTQGNPRETRSKFRVTQNNLGVLHLERVEKNSKQLESDSEKARSNSEQVENN